MPDAQGSPLLHTKRLVVYRSERSVATDLENKVLPMTAIPRALTDDALKRLLDESSPEEVVAQMKATFDLIEQSLLCEDREYYAAYLPDGALVGVAGFSDTHGETPEAHITVDIPYQRQGYGKELLSELLPLYLEKPSCKHILYRLRTNNVPSEKLVLSLGGELQPPASIVEALIIKTYHISTVLPDPDKESNRTEAYRPSEN